jgi:hypothetical protein
MELRRALNDIDGEAAEITTADVLEALATLRYTLDLDQDNPAAGAYLHYLVDRLAYKRNENEVLAEYGGDFDEAFAEWFNDVIDEDDE